MSQAGSGASDALKLLKERRAEVQQQQLPPAMQVVQPEPTTSNPVNSTQDPPAQTASEPKLVLKYTWTCSICNHECVPIRSESRCLCGHRLKEHDDESRCKNAKCTCKSFFYIVAEGSWILRCRCKHKHIEHDPVSHACVKAKCDCSKFCSPWVCNCDHPWADHVQSKGMVKVRTIEDMMRDAALVEAGPSAGVSPIAPDVNRWDLVKRGEDAEER